jgi:hypothetical protein
MDWILQAVLSPPESEAIGFDNFPEFSWVVEKTEEMLFRISRVFLPCQKLNNHVLKLRSGARSGNERMPAAHETTQSAPVSPC